jgi:lipopolysaccharide cholinephosphotransferase
MNNSYSSETLKKLKQAELVILKDFGDVCNKYSISWFAIGGTAIGTARHKGFIPWDDDIDVGMLRNDYENFARVCDREMGGKYHLTTPETEKYYSSAVVKLMRKGTKFIPPYATNGRADLGLHIDIFIYDNYTNDIRSEWQIKVARFWDQMLFLRAYGDPEIPGDGMKKKLFRILCHIIHGMLSTLHVSPRWMYQKFTKNAMRFDSEETECVTIFQDSRIFDSRLKRSEIFPTKMMPFEDIKIPMMNDYMTALIRYYGKDVMQLPPEEKRVNHAAAVLDFGDILDC